MPRQIPHLPREFVAAAQRYRVVDAVAEIAHESGVAGVTTAAICQRARMARSTFYGHFDGRSGCLRYSFAEAHREIFEPLAAATGDECLSAVEATIADLHGSVASHPLLAELCLVHSAAAREEAAGADFEAAVDTVAKLLSQARTGDGLPSNPFVEEFLARALVSLAASRARRGEAAKLLSERREIVSLVAHAYPG